jgi:Cu+-exporting ATPase
MERDPVCGMLVDPRDAAGSREYQGQVYYFCSPACLAKFDQAPQCYVGTPSPPPSRQG